MATTPYTTLITPAQLQALQQNAPGSVMVFDCTFELTQPLAGEALYDEVHIGGAIYANLDKNLSAPHDGAGRVVAAASGGRHPLPTRETFATWLSQVGFRNDMQAVVYDRNGVNYAGRLWWMLKWVGHDAVAVLDGGLQAWQAMDRDAEYTFCARYECQPECACCKPTLQHDLRLTRHRGGQCNFRGLHHHGGGQHDARRWRRHCAAISRRAYACRCLHRGRLASAGCCQR